MLKMKKSGLLGLVVLVLMAYTVTAQRSVQKEVPAEYGYIVKTGQQLPDFTMTLTDGKTVKSSDFTGKVVMLQFTASWCSVCRKEMPHIEKEIWQKYQNHPDFALYGIDMDEPLEKVVKFSRDVGITYPLALDPGAKIFYTFAADKAGVTRNVIVDKTGKIVFMTRLYKVEEFNKMKEVIAGLLKK
jgi:peroxiredoxin